MFNSTCNGEMVVKRTAEENAKISAEKFNNHIQTLKHLNKLRPEIIKKIDNDELIAFEKMDDKEKSIKLGKFFRQTTRPFNVNSTPNDVIAHFKKYIEFADFLKRVLD